MEVLAYMFISQNFAVYKVLFHVLSCLVLRIALQAFTIPI